MSSALDRLCAYLDKLRPGPLAEPEELEGLLASCWEEFDGSDLEGMAARKLGGRMEDVTWEPPLVAFTIERHGGTVLGSTRAERHGWTLDLKTMTASCGLLGFRQVRPMEPRLNVEPLAAELFELMQAGAQDERLRWNADGSVRIEIGKVIVAGRLAKETVIGRRSRFRSAVSRLVVAAGGEYVRPNVYRLPPIGQP